MTIKALEINLNGEKLYTVGLQNWAALGANIMGHRQTREDIEKLMEMAGQPIPDLDPNGFETFIFHANVFERLAEESGTSSAHTYESKTLQLGDVITIRLIETDHPDKAKPPEPHGHGPRAVLLPESSTT